MRPALNRCRLPECVARLRGWLWQRSLVAERYARFPAQCLQRICGRSHRRMLRLGLPLEILSDDLRVLLNKAPFWTEQTEEQYEIFERDSAFRQNHQKNQCGHNSDGHTDR